MSHCFRLAFLFLLFACQQPKKNKSFQTPAANEPNRDTTITRSYEEVKRSIEEKRKQFSSTHLPGGCNTNECNEDLTGFWIKAIGTELYEQWKNTPWDFNGTTTKPRDGKIACGFFVTTILQDMGLKINRHKLAICASSEMMKSLTPY